MTYIFKGMDIVLANGSHVKFDRFIYDGFTKIGWFDLQGESHEMKDLESCNKRNIIITIL